MTTKKRRSPLVTRNTMVPSALLFHSGINISVVIIRKYFAELHRLCIPAVSGSINPSLGFRLLDRATLSWHWIRTTKRKSILIWMTGTISVNCATASSGLLYDCRWTGVEMKCFCLGNISVIIWPYLHTLRVTCVEILILTALVRV